MLIPTSVKVHLALGHTASLTCDTPKYPDSL
jgi:hypothetical protein